MIATAAYQVVATVATVVKNATNVVKNAHVVEVGAGVTGEIGGEAKWKTITQ